MIRFRTGSAADVLDKARAVRGAEAIDLFRRAAVLAERSGDLETAFTARTELVSEGFDADAMVDQVVAFAWCLHQAEEDPARFDLHELAWTFKWIAGAVAKTSSVPLHVVDRVLEEFRSTYRRLGLGSAPADQLEAENLIATNRPEGLAAAYARWEGNADRSGSDCDACVQLFRVSVSLGLGDDEEALARAEPLVDGKMGCGEVPHIAFGRLLLPALRLGLPERAREFDVAGRRMIGGEDQFLASSGQHLAYAGIARSIDDGARLYERFHKRGVTSKNEWARLHFHQGAAALWRGALRAGVRSVHLTLSPRHPLFDALGTYAVEELHGAHAAEASGLARAFDARNGNGAEQERIEEIERWVDRGLPI